MGDPFGMRGADPLLLFLPIIHGYLIMRFKTWYKLVPSKELGTSLLQIEKSNILTFKYATSLGMLRKQLSEQRRTRAPAAYDERRSKVVRDLHGSVDADRRTNVARQRKRERRHRVELVRVVRKRTSLCWTSVC